MSNAALNRAKKAKNDEFYTQLADIEAELQHYTKHFVGKTVYCNCDDPHWSNFYRYFSDNFAGLGLKKLIATCYAGLGSDGAYKAVKTAEGEEITRLESNGDFRSGECVELLKEADIVVTNPPFSLFREYVAQLFEYGKKFLIVGHQNAITYKEFFSYIKTGKVWLGCSIHSGDREFMVHLSYPLAAAGFRVDGNGNKFIRVKGIRWFTNLDYKERHAPLSLYKTYAPEFYPKYDDYDAINVDKTADIPADYLETMGVPITFLDKFCPEQFEIIGQLYAPPINGARKYRRLLIKRKPL